MSFVKIDGFPIGVIETPATRAGTRKGQRSRSARGQIRDPRRGQRATYSFATEPLTREEADAHEGWLLGRGHIWHFSDGLHAASQLGFDPGYSGIRLDPTTTGPTADFPGVATVIEATGRPFAAIDAQIEDDEKWTVGVTIDGETKFKRGDGFGFLEDGDKSTTFLEPGSGIDMSVRVIDGRVFLISELSAPPAFELGLLAIWPFLIPDRWFGLWNANDAGPRPILRCEGEAFREDPIWCVGDVLPQTQIEIEDGAAWDVAARSIRFRLTEVPPKYFSPDALPLGTITP